MASVVPFFKRFIPSLAPVSASERVRASVGAIVGILITGLVAGFALRNSHDLPLLIAPMGASAVLLFAVPASPLAQPWSIMGGNTISALIGVTCALVITDPVIAAAVAGGLAIAAMMALRCLHPPSGAVALTAVLGGPAIHAAGYGFVLWPVGLNSLLLLIAALVFNNLTGRRYPHLATPPAPKADPAPVSRLGFTSADLNAVLADYDQVLPVGTDDLEDILHQAEIRAFERRSGGVTAGQVMSRKLAQVTPDTHLREALALLRSHHIKALPVVDRERHVVGILTQTDLLDKADWGTSTGSGLGYRLRAITNSDKSLRGIVGDIMTTPVQSVPLDLPIAQLVPIMTAGGHHHLPVVDRNGILEGIVTQSDVIAALFSVGTDRASE
ncbi:HPP family protein [Devosia sp.]|uniref:HPP family protein n=1 Tax=Devosia sp. TaxID=1871048 RepID=UPI00326789BE